MNKRILKKLCKQAHPLLLQMGHPANGFFWSERSDPPYWEATKMERKHLERFRGRPQRYQFEALPNTVGFEWRCSYECEEYEDEPAYSRLESWFLCEHTDWSQEGVRYFGPRNATPRQVFKWATEFSNGGSTDGA